MTTLDSYIRRYVSISAVIDTLRRKELALLDPQNWDDKNDSYFMSLYKIHKNIPALYALCASSCSETYHHWRVFTGGADGACIEIERQPFEEALNQERTIRFGLVEYLKLEQIDQLHSTEFERLPFCKRVGFAAEEEYRIVAWSHEKQANALGLEIELRWINKIYLNPWMPKPLADSLKQTLRELPGCSKLSIGRSLLINSQRWKEAGERMVKHQPTKPLVKHLLKKR